MNVSNVALTQILSLEILSEERMLFYHPYMGDWELCIGDEPNDVSRKHW